MKRSLWQITNSLVPYLALWVLMVITFGISYWLTLGLTIVASAFLLRVFIIFHDCGHGSFFRSRHVSNVFGFVTGVLTLTPHRQWWRQHMLHHATNADLDRRGTGDVWTMTISEYQAAPRWQRFAYRCVRNPLFMLTLGPIILFVVLYRFPTRHSRRGEHLSILGTNIALGLLVTTLILTIGWKAYLLIHLPIIIISGAAGIWLFYVQHQFAAVQWQRNKSWDFASAALQGSSYYQLPRWLQWFTGNIGFHHVHHLNPLVPNYHLENCHREHEVLQQVSVLTLRSSLTSLTLRLWDESNRRMVGFDALRKPATASSKD